MADRPGLKTLSWRARSIVDSYGTWIDVPDISSWRQAWATECGVPSTVLDRVEAFQARWGGLVLPPLPGDCGYDGGPAVLSADLPERVPGATAAAWWFEAGSPRTALPFSFGIGPDGSFGLAMDSWVPLHRSVEGWIEAVALALAAVEEAKEICRYSGDDVAKVDLTGMEPVAETAGLADTWWYRPGRLVALYTGAAELFGRSGYREASVYTGVAPGVVNTQRSS
ncbi:hypothetical protein WEH80_38685 [Actinomycetes bacterium KLBMP 9759]